MQQVKKKRGLFSIFSPFLIYYAISTVVEVVAMTILLMPKMTEIMLMDPADATVEHLMQEYMPFMVEQFMKNLPIITMAVAACTIPCFLLQFRNDIKYEKMIGIPTKAKAAFWKYSVLIGIAIAVGIGATNILTLSNVANYSKSYEETSAMLYSASFGLQLLGYGIVVPIAEELMFRGLLYKRLMYLGGKYNAMFISALVFGFYHGNLVQGIYGFIVGYIAVYIYDKYGSIWAPIFLHGVMNTISVIGTEYKLFNWIFHDAMRVAIVTVLCAAVGSSMFVVMQRICSDKIESEKDVPSV